ncbi:MAG TPA: tRNA (adenosine(37)-N6)-dimethylallyltransferase MiaA [Polyangiaceae bacterium]|nr:tRNA (adenosine(37)-N6)-dimethylallyltransferase MiaA [Polyangiaceae bacterium]
MSAGDDVDPLRQALSLAREHPDELLAVVGPTASGKTALAVELAERLGGEVVSADSVQIYRGFDVGAGKPSAEELRRAPHHLVSVLDPMDHVDAASWAERASGAIRDVRARGRVPIVCGGTFLWVKALLFGLAEAPSANAEVRGRHRALAEAEGRPAVHDRLRAVDPESAARLHPNDLVRVSRALEVFELTGRPLAAWQREHAFARVRHPAKLVAVRCEGEVLTERMRTRVRAWLAEGWVDEVERLLAAGYGQARGMGSVGYAQIRAMLAGALALGDLEAAIVRATRLFARRQRTWLNHADVVWLGEPRP